MSGLFLWNSHAINNDQKAFSFLEAKQHKMALAFLDALDADAKRAKFELYRAYVLREQNSLTESTTSLKKALERDASKKEIHLEILLNLCFNAYLTKNSSLMQESLIHLRQLPSSNQYANLFKALEAYSLKDYQKALSYLEDYKSEKPLSPWMQFAFEKHFSQDWIDKHIVLCLIEESLYTQANRKLDLMKESDLTHFLRALCYFKTSQEISFEIAFTLHKKAITELSLLNNETDLNDDLKNLKDWLQSMSLHFAVSRNFSEFSLYSSSFQSLATNEELAHFAPLLNSEIERTLSCNEKISALNLLQHVHQNILVKQLYMIKQAMHEMVKKGDVEQLENYFNLLSSFQSQESDLNQFTKDVAETAFATFVQKKGNKETGIHLLTFFDTHETNAEIRLEVANKLINLAKCLWLQDENYEKAIQLLTFAKNIPSEENGELILDNLELTILSLYNKAKNQDLALPCLYAVKAANRLNLNLQLCDAGQKQQLVEDALFFFEKGHDGIAYEKALFILELEPENKQANRIIGLIAYDKGHFEKALAHLTQIKEPDLTILKVLKHIQPK